MKKKSWDDDLPDTTQWQPREDVSETLLDAFYKRCLYTERRILLNSKHERDMSMDAFDSGPGLEDIIRKELGEICPKRYSVRAGTIDDRQGRSAGDFEIIIVNDIWFPAIKPGATDYSRKIHFPIESIYSAIEIKQTLSYDELDNAMKKLVMCQRLYRPSTEGDRIIENRRMGNCRHKTTNHLLSLIIATDIKNGITVDDLVNRFCMINKSLKRKEVIGALCVLGYGTVMWGYKENKTSIKMASFMDDLDQALVPTYHRVTSTDDSALYPLMVLLLAHLYRSVLGAEDIAANYGGVRIINTLSPKDNSIILNPDPLANFILPYEW